MRNVLWLSFFIGLLSMRVALAEPLPKDLHCMPVLIQIPVASNKTSVGTGVYLVESNRVFLVTAKHVIFDITSTNVPLPLINTNAIICAWSRDTTNSRKNMLSVDLKSANDRGFVRQH